MISFLTKRSEYRYDRNVRLISQLFLLHIWPSLVQVQQDQLVKELIVRHSQIAFQERRPRFCTNSLEHRVMFRSLQCLLCLTSVIKDSVRTRTKHRPNFAICFSRQSILKTIYDHVLESLMIENEPSLRLLAEWIIVRLIFEDRKTRLNDLFEHLKNAHRFRIGTICAWISISSHVLQYFSESTEQVRLDEKFLSKRTK